MTTWTAFAFVFWPDYFYDFGQHRLNFTWTKYVFAGQMFKIIDESKISFTGSALNQETIKFNVTIESFDCKLNADLTTGQSVYKGYIHQMDGSTKPTSIKIEAKEGYLTISDADPTKTESMTMIVSKWEVVKE